MFTFYLEVVNKFEGRIYPLTLSEPVPIHRKAMHADKYSVLKPVNVQTPDSVKQREDY